MNKGMKKNIFLAMAIAAVGVVTAQEPVQSTSEVKEEVVVTDFKRVKIDGVAAVIGDYAILESDISKMYVDLETQGVSTKGITRCSLLGKLMEDKLYAHQAVQDSIIISHSEVKATNDRQIDYLVGSKFGTIEKLLEFYNSDSEESFREKLTEVNKVRMLSERMQTKIVEEIEVTPEEVRNYFKSIPKADRPVFGAELEIAQIVKQPEIPEEEKQKIIDQLNGIRRDVLDNGASFNVKAILYSKDPGSASKGGFYKMTRKTQFVKEFKDVAFSLQEGEISEPFETVFGYHIIFLEKIRGQELDLRHIVIMPEVPQWSIDKANKEIKDLKDKIEKGEISFDEAARLYSDEKETKYDGGLLRNPATLDTKFELTKIDPSLYNQVRDLKDDEISLPLVDQDPRTQRQIFKILKVTNRYEEHEANFAKDYIKIKDLALKEKQLKEVKSWMTEHIEDTFISINEDNKECDFQNNWLKK